MVRSISKSFLRKSRCLQCDVYVEASIFGLHISFRWHSPDAECRCGCVPPAGSFVIARTIRTLRLIPHKTHRGPTIYLFSRLRPVTMTTGTKNVMQAGAASRNITPPVGVAMQGYKLRHADAINDPILGSALAVGGDRVEWLLLSIAAIGLDRGFTYRIRKM